MGFFSKKIKASSAPKTEDLRFDEASALFQTHSLTLSDVRDPIASIVKSLLALGSVCAKFSDDLTILLADGNPLPNPKLGETAVAFSRSEQWLRRETAPLFANRVAPNFLDAIAAYEVRFAEVAKLKANRAKAVADFDRDRELVRLAETAKKPKQSDIDKARQKCEDAHARYEASNEAFMKAVLAFEADRVSALMDPFKRLLGIFVQFARKVTPDPHREKVVEIQQSVSTRPRPTPFEEVKLPTDSRERKLSHLISFGRIDEMDFRRGGWQDSGVRFVAPPLPSHQPKPNSLGMVNPFEEDDSSIWEAQLAAARLTDLTEEFEGDAYNPFK
jgi:hypothetical protein